MAHARRNNATGAEVDFGKIFATGAFKNVYLGRYTVGARSGQRCVAKEFKPEYRGSPYETRYFRQELRDVKHTQMIVDSFNYTGVLGHQRIYVNTPEVWRFNADKQPYLVEPVIKNFKKYNSNSGWVLKLWISDWSNVLQALSHFSYHNSGGKYLLCDVQGGEVPEGFILTDPIIMSVAGAGGPGDLGRDGIFNFFKKHRCTKFCQRHWLTPSGGGSGGARFDVRKGTFFPRR